MSLQAHVLKIPAPTSKSLKKISAPQVWNSHNPRKHGSYGFEAYPNTASYNFLTPQYVMNMIQDITATA